MTRPRGPMETVESWHAGARAGVCVFGAYVWSEGAPSTGIMYHYVRRVKEKESGRVRDTRKRVGVWKGKGVRE